MEDLLFLVHRIPYPPTKGDKVRSYHLLEYLRHRYRIHLGAFVDDPADWQHVADVRRVCEDAYIARLDPRMSRVRSLTGLLTGEPLTLSYFRNNGMQAWVKERLSNGSIGRVLVFSSAMAQYVLPYIREGLRCVIDLVDVDSDKWRQYADKKSWPVSHIYRRESKLLLGYERRLAASFDASVFVSRQEADLFKRLAPEVAERVIYFNNGVDTDYFSPRIEHANPYPDGAEVLVFTGAMDYWANVDAVCWFVQDVFPKIRARRPNARFYIVGARPTSTVTALGKRAGVTVTGTVDDVRPYIAHAAACVAPLRIARGVQNKVLEALAMGKPLLATTAAMEGIEAHPEMSQLIKDDPDELAEQAVQLVSAKDSSRAAHGTREWISKHYDWNRNIERLAEQLEATGEAVSAAGMSTRQQVGEMAVGR